MRTVLSLSPILLAATLVLTGCDTAEERAEGHYQRALELLAEGDTDRAMLEFRNVFKLNGEYVEARLRYAEVLRDRGDFREAFSHYLLVADQQPDNITARRNLAEMALAGQDLETAKTHVGKAYALDPQDPTIRALKATVDYRDEGRREDALAMARDVIAEAPEVVAAYMLLIGDRLRAEEPAEALTLIDTALETSPADEGLHLTRLATLEMLGDTAGTGAELQQMSQMFPDNEGVHQALIQWYLHSGDTDAAETLLRTRAAEAPDTPEPALTVVSFLYELRGGDAARAELEKLIASTEDSGPFITAMAELDYTEGRTDEAIAGLQALLEGAEATDKTREMQVILARMLLGTGAVEEGSALLNTVIEGDRHNVPALKIRAQMAVEDDRPQDAVQDMRTALTQAPRDPEIMTIMALAHEREGSRELMGERLALAVETSNRGVGESLRYATYLMQEGRAGPAETVIVDALRRAPENADLLNALGQIHLERKDWERAEQTARLLQAQGNPVSTAMANALQTESLRLQGRTEELMTRLEELAGTGDDGNALVSLVRSQVAAGEIDAARSHLESLLAQAPKDLQARQLLAGLDATTGNLETAEAQYRSLIADAPGLAQPYQALFTLLAAQGRTDGAEAVLTDGIAASEDNGRLLFIQAGILEARGDVDGAIANYEKLYKRDSRDPVVANNLASLLTGTGAGPEELDRAFAIARRLRGSEVPFFQDTYGWILYLRGDPEQALDHIRPAAAALPDNALVQFHLGETEFALKHWDAAEAAYRRALAVSETVGPALPAAQISGIEARLQEIAAGAAAPSGNAAPQSPETEG